jgi:hypothetical protein
VGNTYGQGEVGDERGSKEMDRCPLTETPSPGDNLNTTQTPECIKEKYNAKIKMKGSLLRSHQQPM